MPELDKTMMAMIKDQLVSEVKADAKYAASALHAEFGGGTVEVQGPDADAMLQEKWVSDPKWVIEYIDQVGPEKWWEQMFTHVAKNATTSGREIFMNAIQNGIGFNDALHFATVLGDMLPERPPAPPMMDVPPPPPLPGTFQAPPAPPMPEPVPPEPVMPPPPVPGVM